MPSVPSNQDDAVRHDVVTRGKILMVSVTAFGATLAGSILYLSDRITVQTCPETRSQPGVGVSRYGVNNRRVPAASSEVTMVEVGYFLSSEEHNPRDLVH